MLMRSHAVTTPGSPAPGAPSLDDVTITVCSLCLSGPDGGRGDGCCYTPGCVFWMCPAPDSEQAEALRFVLEGAR